MFAMVTPPVLFFAHALSNYSEVFNKINTFFQKNSVFFRIFSCTCGCGSAGNTIYRCCTCAIRNHRKAENICHKEKGSRLIAIKFAVKGYFLDGTKSLRHYFYQRKRGKTVEYSRIRLCKLKCMNGVLAPVEMPCGKTCGDCGKV